MLDPSQMSRTPNILEPNRDLNRFSICKLHFKNHCQELRWFVIGLIKIAVNAPGIVASMHFSYEPKEISNLSFGLGAKFQVTVM